MADTLDLAAAVDFVTARGGQVRLIGDDQQLAAIGAGGVLRDIAATHGARRTCTDCPVHRPRRSRRLPRPPRRRPRGARVLPRPRPGPRRRPATVTEHAFTAWAADRAAGLDSIMLAPTRELVAELNQRARSRPPRRGAATAGAGSHAWPTATPASAGDTDHHPPQRPPARLTRDRLGQERRPVDRPHRPPDGRLTVQHTCAPAAPSTLPAGYVAASRRARLRHHRARRPRRHRRHLPHRRHRRGVPPAALHDAHPRPRRQPPLPATSSATATRTPSSAPTASTPRPPPTSSTQHPRPRRRPRLGHHLRAPARSPAPRLGRRRRPLPRRPARRRRGPPRPRQPSPRSTHARRPAGPGHRRRPRLAHPARPPDPARRRRHRPDTALSPHAVAPRELDTAADRAAVLDWRLDDTPLRHAGPGPLPWLPGIPAALADHPTGAPTCRPRDPRRRPRVRRPSGSDRRSPPLAPTRTAHPRPTGAHRPRGLAGGERRPRQ